MTKQISKIEDLTPLEIMNAVLLWCYNWREEDFKKAFKDSKIGWDYHWNKLQIKCSMGNQSTSAIVDVILNMDTPHQKMLLDFIFSKSSKTIQSGREWNVLIEENQNSNQ